MTIDQFLNKLSNNQREIQRLMDTVLPVKIGNMAKNHFRQNFIRSGFVNNGLQKWQPTKRQESGKKGTRYKYKPLISSRNHLFNSTNYTVQPGQATIHNKVHYASVHNEGLRAGRGKGFIMPKREFVGESAELNKQIKDKIESELRIIINK